MKSGGAASAVGLGFASLITAVGTLWAFQRGAPDFSVFLAAGKLVLEGHGLEIYARSPDRFLYAPGFAWLIAPLAWLPREVALALWCFAKAAVIGAVIAPALRDRAGRFGLAAWAVVMLARPVLIDFQYGQVNLFILGAGVWALRRHFSAAPESVDDSARKKTLPTDFVAWFALTLAAITKIFALPLLLVPLLAPGRRRRTELTAIAAGTLVYLMVPAVSVGLSSLPGLYVGWLQALLDKGLPLESHNQSFAAFLHHYFSGEVTHVISLGSTWIALGSPLLSLSAVSLLSMAWLSFALAFVTSWFLMRERFSAGLWSAVLIAVLILPSHLVWKPYFVMAIPLGMQALRLAHAPWHFGLLAIIGVVINLSGFDFVGGAWSARFEAASGFLWADLVLLAFTLWLSRDKPTRSAFRSPAAAGRSSIA